MQFLLAPYHQAGENGRDFDLAEGKSPENVQTRHNPDTNPPVEIATPSDRYTKSVEVAPDGVYLSDHLADVIEHCYKELRASANQSQMVASGWIAIPESVSLDEAHAARIFEAVGAWNQQKVAA
ncbi:UNVERIFIED_ORG: hypothetical protein J2W82_000691 [Pseudomonas mohnii]|nr:hypothetical protein [Pseudomonas mohnii]